MASPAALRDAIQTRLATVSGLRAFDLVQGAIPTPCAFVRPSAVDQVTKDDGRDYTFTVDLYVSLNSMRTAQDQMDGYWPGGANDIQSAVESDQTLGGIAGWATCDPVDGSYDIVTLGPEGHEVPYLACQFTVAVGA